MNNQQIASKLRITEERAAAFMERLEGLPEGTRNPALIMAVGAVAGGLLSFEQVEAVFVSLPIGTPKIVIKSSDPKTAAAKIVKEFTDMTQPKDSAKG